MTLKLYCLTDEIMPGSTGGHIHHKGFIIAWWISVRRYATCSEMVLNTVCHFSYHSGLVSIAAILLRRKGICIANGPADADRNSGRELGKLSIIEDRYSDIVLNTITQRSSGAVARVKLPDARVGETWRIIVPVVSITVTLIVLSVTFSCCTSFCRVKDTLCRRNMKAKMTDRAPKA